MDAVPSAFPTRPWPLVAPCRPDEAAAAGATTLPLLRRESRPVRAPETLHPALWLGHQLGRQAVQGVPSGFAALDAQLPGGGWPRRVLTELLQSQCGIGEMRLLGPSLAAVQRGGRLVMLFDPP